MIKFLKTFWRGLDFLRRLTLNLVFFAVVIGVIFAVLYEKPVGVPQGSVLLVTLSGQISEEDDFNSQGTFASMVDGSDSTTRLRDVTGALTLAAADKRIVAVHFRVQDLQKAGLASLREIGSAMDRVKAAGKKITVWSTGYSQAQYAVAAHANEVFVHPMGGVMLRGISGTRLYWGEALKNLGVTVHVYRAGEFKSAPEAFVRSSPSKESLEADRFWMKDVWRQYTANIESSRGLMPGAVDKMIATYPELLEKAQGDMSRVALDQSLIDSVYTSDEVVDILRTRMGWKTAADEKLVDYRSYLDAVETAPSGKRIAVVTIEGEIKDGGDGPGMTGERDAVERLRLVRESPDYAALVVRIDSPGGSTVASELIRRELELVKKAGKPVVASFGDYARATA